MADTPSKCDIIADQREILSYLPHVSFHKIGGLQKFEYDLNQFVHGQFGTGGALHNEAVSTHSAILLGMVDDLIQDVAVVGPI
jgi:hypothetical protein